MTMTKGRQVSISFAEPHIGLEIYDIQGKKAYYSNKDGEMVFDSALNPPGIYFLFAEFTRGRWIRKKVILP